MQEINVNGDYMKADVMSQEGKDESWKAVSKVQKAESKQESITFVSHFSKERLTKSKKNRTNKKQLDVKKSGKQRSIIDSSDDESLKMSYTEKARDNQPLESKRTNLQVAMQSSGVGLSNDVSEMSIVLDETLVSSLYDTIVKEVDSSNVKDQLADWIPTSYDENDDLDMSPEELAAQARAARLAVEIFEAQRVQDVGFRDTLDRPSKYDWNVEFDDDEPTDQDLLEIDLEMFGETLIKNDDVFPTGSSGFNNINVDDENQGVNGIGLPSTTDWTVMKVADLRRELNTRGIKATGTKAVLIAALQKAESDAKQDGVKNDGLENLKKPNTDKEFEFNAAASAMPDVPEKDDTATIKSSSMFEAMTINQLRSELKLRGLKTTGKKVELIERLMAVQRSFD
jgi:hypothetical protein